MVVENGAIASLNMFLLSVWMEPDYFGTAPLQDDRRQRVSEKKVGWGVRTGWLLSCGFFSVFPVGHGLLTMVDGQFLVHDSCFLRHMHGKT